MKSNKRNTSFRFAIVLLFSLLAMASVAVAQLPVPASSQFDITGFIQSATLGGPGTGPGTGAHQGGVITVNGHVDHSTLGNNRDSARERAYLAGTFRASPGSLHRSGNGHGAGRRSRAPHNL